MRLRWVKKGSKWKRRLSLDTDEWITIIIVLLTLNYIMLRLIFSKV